MDTPSYRPDLPGQDHHPEEMPRQRGHTEGARPAVHPWRRYWARQLDFLAAAVVWGFLTAPFDMEYISEWPDIVYLPFMVGVHVLVESTSLTLFGTTFGKWLLCIRLQHSDGRPITFDAAFKRSTMVAWRGCGLGLPLVQFLVPLLAFVHLRDRGTTPWDEAYQFTVTHGQPGPLRLASAVLILGLSVALAGLAP